MCCLGGVAADADGVGCCLASSRICCRPNGSGLKSVPVDLAVDMSSSLTVESGVADGFHRRRSRS